MFSYSSVCTLYVSKEFGHESYTGVHYENDSFLNGPLPSIEQALGKVAQMRRAEYLQPVTIKLMDDEYALDKTVNIGDLYQGFLFDYTRQNHITIEPMGDKKVRIVGGKRLTGFQKDTFNGKECYSLYIDEVKNGLWSFRDLYINGRFANRTRYPQNGFLYPEAVENKGFRVRSGWFIAREGDLPSNCGTLDDVTIVFCHYWLEEHLDIANYDSNTRKCTFNGKTYIDITETKGEGGTMEYYVENLPTAFGRERDFYLDKQTGKLYYIPSHDENMENAEIYAPVVNQLFNVEGNDKVAGIRFRNLVFAYSKSDFTYIEKSIIEENGTKIEKRQIIGSDRQCLPHMHGAIHFKNVTDSHIDNCEFFCLGGHAVHVDESCDHCSVENSHIHNISGGGISITGGVLEDEDKWTHDITVRNCHLEHLGEVFHGAAGILLTHGFDCNFSENIIHDLHYSGICLGWIWGYAPSVTHGNIVYKNHIYNLGSGILSDMGGIYTLGRQDGTVISYNCIHDIKSRNYGGWALYADEGSENILFEKNVCYNVSCNCFHLHYGRMNVLRNNYFRDAKESLILCTPRGEAHCGLIAYENILDVTHSIAYEGSGPSLLSSDNNYLISDNDDPVMWRLGETIISLKDVRSHFDWDRYSKFADAKLVLNKDYISMWEKK